MNTFFRLFMFLNKIVASGIKDEFFYGKFPKDFMWGVATSAYQIEGGWDADGKGPSTWDVFSHQGKNRNNETGDIACDSYHKYMDDVEIVRDLKVNYYRFSLSWSRVLPTGTIDKINEKGIQYYNNLINALIDAKIAPVVTMFHWDTPQTLEEHGGWLNESIVDHIADYSRLCFERFGDRVKFWITVNEPWVLAFQGHEIGSKAPGIVSHGDKVYLVGHNMIKAHAKMYHIYDKEYRQKQKGKISFTMNAEWGEPKNKNNKSDEEASERAMEFTLGWFANPVFGNGDYPEIMKQQIDNRSRLQKLSKSRLPAFTENEKRFIKGTYDYIGVNFYTSRVVTRKEYPIEPASYPADHGVEYTIDPSWMSSGSSWLKITPWGIRETLKWVKRKYGDVPIYIIENGFSDISGSLEDNDRIYSYKHHINEVLKVFQRKKKLKGNKSKIFITEDLTKSRQKIVNKLIQAKSNKHTDSYWTMDGRIFCKVSKDDTKIMIKSYEQICDLVGETVNTMTDVEPHNISSSVASNHNENDFNFQLGLES